MEEAINEAIKSIEEKLAHYKDKKYFGEIDIRMMLQNGDVEYLDFTLTERRKFKTDKSKSFINR